MQQKKMVLTVQASEALDERAFGIAIEYNSQAAASFLNHIDNALDNIQAHPQIGIIEKAFPDYRILITSKMWKIPYKIDEETITVYPIFR